MKIEWPTILFMIAVHTLAVVALQPQYWSWGALWVLLILYWVTACLGVTLGYLPGQVDLTWYHIVLLNHEST